LQYEAPVSVKEAVEILAAHPGQCKPLAGGTDLIIQMRGTNRYPKIVVDLKRIPELTGITRVNGSFRLGAAASCAQLTDHSELQKWLPGVVEATELIGSVQVQSRASLGGNLCNGSPAADTVPALIAVGARAVVVGPSGTRTVPVAGFVTAPGKTVLLPGELVVALEVDLPEARSADAYLRFIPRAEMDIAVVGAGVSLTFDKDGVCTAAQVALGAVAPTQLTVPAAVKALVGTKVEDSAIAEAGKAARAAAKPIDDRRGTADFRRHITDVLTVRSLKLARERALSR